MVQWFYLISAALFFTISWIYIILGILVKDDTMSDLIILIGQCELYSMVQWFCLISPTLFDCIWRWPIFHGPVILLNVCNTIPWIYIILRILFGMTLWVSSFYLLVIMTYFMVQWFCLTSPNTIDGFPIYLRCWFNMTLWVSPKYLLVSATIFYGSMM